LWLPSQYGLFRGLAAAAQPRFGLLRDDDAVDSDDLDLATAFERTVP